MTTIKTHSPRYHFYIRVSSKEQNEARQIQAKNEFIDTNTIPQQDTQVYIDKQTGTNTDRPRLRDMLDNIRSGDVVWIKSIDRLSRNYNECKDLWKEITDKGADIVVDDMPLLDTRQHKDLLGTFISDLILQVLAYVGEQETTFRKQRQREGIEIAKAQGKHLGRPRTEYPDNWEYIYTKWKANKDRKKNDPQRYTRPQASKDLGVSEATFHRMTKRYESENDIK